MDRKAAISMSPVPLESQRVTFVSGQLLVAVGALAAMCSSAGETAHPLLVAYFGQLPAAPLNSMLSQIKAETRAQ